MRVECLVHEVRWNDAKARKVLKDTRVVAIEGTVCFESGYDGACGPTDYRQFKPKPWDLCG